MLMANTAGMPDFPDDIAGLWFLVRRVAKSIDQVGDEIFQRELGLSLAQFLVLSVVDAYPGTLNQQAVADRLGLTKGTVSRQLDNAVAAGLIAVKRSDHSRRDNDVALTPAGEKLVRRGDMLVSEAQHSALPAVSAEDMAATIRVLKSLNVSLTEYR